MTYALDELCYAASVVFPVDDGCAAPATKKNPETLGGRATRGDHQSGFIIKIKWSYARGRVAASEF